MSIFAILDGAEEERHAKVEGHVPHRTHEQRPKGSSDAARMWRVLLQLLVAAHLHEPRVPLAESTSKNDALKRGRGASEAKRRHHPI